MTRKTLLSVFAALCDLTERQLTRLDDLLYPRVQNNTKTETCEYCEKLAKESIQLEREKQLQYEALLQDVERALQLAATAYATKENSLKPKSTDKTLTSGTIPAVKNSANRQNQMPCAPSVHNVKQRVIPRRAVKPSYIPAHQKAPFKTEPCKGNTIPRKQRMNSGIVRSLSSRSTCATTAELHEPKPFFLPTTNSSELDHLQDNHFELPLVESHNNTPPVLNVVNRMMTAGGIESENSNVTETNSMCACKQRIRDDLEHKFCESMRRLLALIHEHQSIDRVRNNEEYANAFYLQCLHNSGSLGLDTFLRCKCDELAGFAVAFQGHLSYLDVEKTDSGQRKWLLSVLSQIQKLQHYLHFLSTIILREESSKFSSSGTVSVSSEPDVVGQWIATNRKPNTSITGDWCNNPILKSYLTLGPSPCGSIRSRVSSLITTPSLCVMDGSAQDLSRFLHLWSELELTNVETMLLTSLRKQLPVFEAEVKNRTEHRASYFRELYGLLCGSSPIALKDSFQQ